MAESKRYPLAPRPKTMIVQNHLTDSPKRVRLPITQDHYHVSSGSEGRSITPSSNSTKSKLGYDYSIPSTPTSQRTFTTNNSHHLLSKVQVAVRMRSFPDLHLNSPIYLDPLVNMVQIDGSFLPPGSGFKLGYKVDTILDDSSTQLEVFSKVAQPMIQPLLDGYNATIMAYGQTSTGKTYTIGTGTKHINLEDTHPDRCYEQEGLISRSVKHVFNEVSAREDIEEDRITITCSFLEVYNDHIFDLLTNQDDVGKERIQVRELGDGTIVWHNCKELEVESPEDVFKILKMGSDKRKTASTLLNHQSSRSHAIFTLKLVQSPHNQSNQSYGHNLAPTKISKLTFVDLAGSERIKKTGAKGDRAKEGININGGLLALGNVISALANKTGNAKVHIPYRDSKLTRLLQDSLGGNSITAMVACISPKSSDLFESVNTLKYASRAKHIRVGAKINEHDAVITDPVILNRMVLNLKQQVNQLNFKLGLGLAPISDTPSGIYRFLGEIDEKPYLEGPVKYLIGRVKQLEEDLLMTKRYLIQSQRARAKLIRSVANQPALPELNSMDNPSPIELQATIHTLNLQLNELQRTNGQMPSDDYLIDSLQTKVQCLQDDNTQISQKARGLGLEIDQLKETKAKDKKIIDDLELDNVKLREKLEKLTNQLMISEGRDGIDWNLKCDDENSIDFDDLPLSKSVLLGLNDIQLHPSLHPAKLRLLKSKDSVSNLPLIEAYHQKSLELQIRSAHIDPTIDPSVFQSPINQGKGKGLKSQDDELNSGLKGISTQTLINFKLGRKEQQQSSEDMEREFRDDDQKSLAKELDKLLANPASSLHQALTQINQLNGMVEQLNTASRNCPQPEIKVDLSAVADHHPHPIQVAEEWDVNEESNPLSPKNLLDTPISCLPIALNPPNIRFNPTSPPRSKSITLATPSPSLKARSFHYSLPSPVIVPEGTLERYQLRSQPKTNNQFKLGHAKTQSLPTKPAQLPRAVALGLEMEHYRNKYASHGTTPHPSASDSNCFATSPPHSYSANKPSPLQSYYQI